MDQQLPLDKDTADMTDICLTTHPPSLKFYLTDFIFPDPPCLYRFIMLDLKW